MPHGTHVRHVRSLAEAQKVLANLQDTVAAGELRPFVISRIKRKELLRNLTQVKYGIFGFDQTLHSASQWTEIRRILGPKAQALWETDISKRPINGQAVTISNLIKGQYLYMSPAGQPLVEQAMLQTEWTAQLIQALKEQQVTREQIRSIAQYLPMRAGAAEILRPMMKVSVISWGLREIINAWLEINGIANAFKRNSIRVLELGATELRFDDQERVTGHVSSSLVVNANKSIKANRFLEGCGVSEGLTLAVGDSIYDMEMMPFVRISAEQAISGVNVLIMSPATALETLNEFDQHRMPRLWQRVTCLLIADDFYPLLELQKEAIQRYDSIGQNKKQIPKEQVKEIFGL
ncbi:haloacid dehalogenase-like hydrolase [Patescibacteria group bacterium]|nr:haloacid dehalogenase-like hydrolase [Patescibacteria group bacterium]MBU1705628.1 haloacid dehalogenase-like hydrolase [Patescibacteria group bacterium]